MTEEQIKSLKACDKITVVFVVKEANDEYASLSFESGDFYGGSTKKFWSLLKHATIVTPPPTFEGGDTVRIVPDPLTGTIYSATHRRTDIKEGDIAVVNFGTDGMGMVKISRNILEKPELDGIYVNAHCLELVKKAVRDKYRVNEAQSEWQIIYGANDCNFVAAWNKSNHPDPKAAAEAECARLNAEWRKQQESASAESCGVTKGGAE